MNESEIQIQYGSIKIGQVVKAMIEGIGQCALLDCVDSAEVEKVKKMLGRMKHIDEEAR
ncbi:MAG: hypothetical protein IJ673_11065 [Treponema sp.]|nr:hypothetical protein [Treponema sp.]